MTFNILNMLFNYSRTPRNDPQRRRGDNISDIARDYFVDSLRRSTYTWGPIATQNEVPNSSTTNWDGLYEAMRRVARSRDRGGNRGGYDPVYKAPK